MLTGILVFFALVFIVVLAFSSSTKEVRVTKIDPVTGQEVVEIHRTNGASPAQSAAKAVVWVIIFVVFGVLVLFVSLMVLAPHS